MQRAVIDTNTWVSGLLWSGAPRQLIQLVLGRGLRYQRIEKVLVKRGLTALDLSRKIGLVSDLVIAPADLIVSGDKDLLVLQSFQGIPILTPAQALQRLDTPIT